MATSFVAPTPVPSASMTASTSIASPVTSATTLNHSTSLCDKTSDPASSGDGNSGGASAMNAQKSSSSNGSSPLRRLPPVLRTPGSTTITSHTTTTTATTTTRSLKAPPTTQSSPLSTTNTVAGNRNVTGISRRHMVTPQYSDNGAYSPVQKPLPYYGSEGGRVTTSGSSSYNRNMSSPMSSPAMVNESWTGTTSAPRGLKRHLLQQYDGYSGRASSLARFRGPDHRPGAQLAPNGGKTHRRGPSSISSSRSVPLMQPMCTMPPTDDPRRYELVAEARHVRDSIRYETWTSKQLRKKCSHLKLRGLKNVKKHVMVEALYRYYRNQRLKEMAEAARTENTGSSTSPEMASLQPPTYPRRIDDPRSLSVGNTSTLDTRSESQYHSRYDRQLPPPLGSSSSKRCSSAGKYGSQSPSPPSSGGDSQLHRHGPMTRQYYQDEETKSEAHVKEVPVTSEDVIRLVDVVLSPEFVDRLAAELSRWQFWVDVREMYIALLNRQHPVGATRTDGDNGPGASERAINSRDFKWSSMQLWEIWKELSFAYTKTCFEFTAAGVDDREYINFCNGRPDVYYLHQRLHLRPDLLHLIKSNEYIDENCTSDASESIAHEQQQAQRQQLAGPLVGSGSPMLRTLKRYNRFVPIATASGAYNRARAMAAFRSGEGSFPAHGATDGASAPGPESRASRGPVPEENSTENSETTGEEGSSNAANSNASHSSHDVSMRAALAEQKYFGLLLQNFEVIFESLHNKKVLLATLRKDSKAPDQLIADLHDDIHVLSALKKDFRNKLRRTVQ